MEYLKVLAGCLILAISGCGGGSDGSSNSGSSMATNPSSTTATSTATSTVKISELENSGLIPKLDRTSSLGGSDTNTNGIRDDIDAYLQSKYSDAIQLKAAQQEAKAMQRAVLVDAANPDLTKAVSQSLDNSTHCLFSKFTDTEGELAPEAVGGDIEAITTNTKIRLKAYLAYNKSRNGTVSSSPKGDTCE